MTPASRHRLLGVVVTAGQLVVGCGWDGPPVEQRVTVSTDAETALRAAPGSPPSSSFTLPTVVSVEVQRCRRPNLVRGQAVAVGGPLAITAAHNVEGPLRSLRIDGAEAEVVAIETSSDLALVAVDGFEADVDVRVSEPVDTASDRSGWLVTTTGVREVRNLRSVDLTVNDLSAGRRHLVDALAFDGTVPQGTSGAAVTNSRGELVGVVTLTTIRGPQDPTTYATKIDANTTDLGVDAGVMKGWSSADANERGPIAFVPDCV